ncbi:T-complex 1 [Pyrrhoderma noxium]|uniref:T-complex 1 n=1 Tax=Pyrrhoderma noxium TaxID=2282107 RepID=A0A286UUB6_9AGAM|nr:T-complex 1 [Pyrrhoderma noxium]
MEISEPHKFFGWIVERFDEITSPAKYYSGSLDGPEGAAIGVNISEDDIDGTLDAAAHGIVDSLAAKSWAIRLATEAAVSVLSVDSIIMSKPAGGPKIPQQSGNWDED